MTARMSVGIGMSDLVIELGAQRRRRMKITIGIAAVAIVALFACANFLVLEYSVRQANDFVAATEKTLVKNEFRHQIEQVVLYQSGISFWDKSFDELGTGTVSEIFVRRDLRHFMRADSGFSWMVFATSAGGPLFAMRDGRVVEAETSGNLLYWIIDLTKRAETSYYEALRRTRDGWNLDRPKASDDLLSPSIPRISATGMRMIEGTMSIVVVQAVVPRRLFIPDHRKTPVLMITVKPMTAEMLQRSQQRLGLTDLGFSPITLVDDDLLTTGVGGDSFNPMVASWRPNRPGSFVWTMALPQITALVAIFVAVMGFVAWKFSSLVRALERSEARNARLARHDALTGALNRSGFEEVVRGLVAKAIEPFAVIAVDLDRFKEVNDSHGHAAGDAVLKAITKRFQTRIGARGTLARLGGDEFAVVLPGEGDPAAILALAQALVRDAQVPIPFAGQLLGVGGSAGAAMFPEHGRTLDGFMQMADHALYEAKNGGRNRAIFAGAEFGKDDPNSNTQAA